MRRFGAVLTQEGGRGEVPSPYTSSRVDAWACSQGWKERTTNKSVSFTG